ncbi:MAG: polysaccharide deacetylase family protein [Chloroflexaceae bacterium]|nr:polysaccharide deacetylase family protein [Chloroflexaceae bacterium]
MQRILIIIGAIIILGGLALLGWQSQSNAGIFAGTATATPTAPPRPPPPHQLPPPPRPHRPTRPRPPPPILPPPTITPTPSPEPTAALLAQAEIGYVPILMYHYVREVDPVQDELGYRLSVTPDVFEQQLLWLKERAYVTISMAHLTECLNGQRTCPPNAVVLTFDDGYADAATEALPLLLKHGFTATFYVVPGFVGKPGYMDWEQIRLLHTSGMEIGSHSISHPDLSALDAEAVRMELTESRAIIEAELGAPVRSFCYPAGKYADTVIELAQAAGYTNAVTTWQGRNMQRIFELPRRRVLGGDPVEAMGWYLAMPDFD